MSETAKAPFSFQEAIERRIECTPDQQLADDEFHLSRVMFAFVNPNDNVNGGILYFSRDDKRDHANWLHDDFKMDETQFENTIRGYIKPLDKNNWCRAIFYKGMAHSPVGINDMQLAAIARLWKTCFPGSPALEIWTGVKIGEIGTVWPPIEHVTTWDMREIDKLSSYAYERYRLHWLMAHDYTLNDVMKELQSVINDTHDGGELDIVPLTHDDLHTIVADAMEYIECESGFGGELWACLDEFRDAEFTMDDYIKNIIPQDRFKTYKQYLPYIKRHQVNIFEDISKGGAPTWKDR